MRVASKPKTKNSVGNLSCTKGAEPYVLSILEKIQADISRPDSKVDHRFFWLLGTTATFLIFIIGLIFKYRAN